MSAFTRLLAIWSFVCLALIPSSLSLASTDSLTWGGNVDRTGYEENHNMDPAVVSSEQFGLLFRTALPGKEPGGGPEQIFASPLVYTASDGVQYVYIATTLNNVYKIHAKNGNIVASRNLARPFLQTDLGTCTDINPTIGVTATGVIDPDTGTWFLTSKTYVDPSPSGDTGRPNGRYYIHGISTDDLSEVPNYPIDIEYTVARNNPLRSFTGGIHHQRPGLLQFNNFIYVGFASHCIQYNYTGWVMGFDKDAASLVEAYALEGQGVGPTTSGAGLWMSGGGIASNGKDSIFFATGNGMASQLDQSPVSGRSPPTALEEAAVHAAVNADGTITPVDFFMPWEKVQLDGADKDLGTSPLQLLPSEFSCGSVERIGMVTGKSGKTYWLNLDDMGGYRNGPNRLDNIIQMYQHENSVYAGAGVYPLEGGYVYVNVINYATRVFQFTCQGGAPYFNPIATTNETNAGRLSVGHGTVTSLGEAGTGLLWVSDMDGSNLRIYDPVPDESGQMTMLNSFATPGVTKFSKLAFGDGVVYQITSSGWLYAYGSPVNLPLDCSSAPFPTTNVNTNSTPQTVTCQAKTDLTITSASSIANFQVTLPTLPLQVAQGTNITFQAVFTPKQLGGLSSSLFLNTTQAASGYTTTTQVQLRGTSQSVNPVLGITPLTVTWNGVITGQSVNETVVLSNLGNSNLSITKIQYSTTSETGPWITPNGTNPAIVGPFTFYGMPSSIGPNSAWTVPINFNPTVSGGYAVYVQVVSNGGTAVFDAFATGADYPQALLEFQSPDGTWTKYDNSTSFHFGNVYAGSISNLKLRLTNVGGPNAAPISVTVSKPPFGIAGSVVGSSNGVDLGEGQLVNSGQNKTANLFCAPPNSQVNQANYSANTTWTMNLNDPNFGHQVIAFDCGVITPQVGPILNGSAQYEYGGCYLESTTQRQLQTLLYSDSTNNTNDRCISGCAAAGYIFAGTEYRQECWCGNNRPATITDDDNCYWECTGNPTETCGGDGVNRNGSYISLFGDSTRWDGNTTKAAGPYTNLGVFGYSSIGCWTDNAANGRTLSVGKTANANSTVASCLTACQGYQYAGLEFGGECYCDNTMLSSAVSAPITDCSMTCKNNYTEYCGAGSRLNVYQLGLNTSTTSSSSLSSTSLTSTRSTTTSITTTTSLVNTTTSMPSTSTSTTQASSTTSLLTSTTLSTTMSSTLPSSTTSPTTSSTSISAIAVPSTTSSSTLSTSTSTSVQSSSTISTQSTSTSTTSSASTTPITSTTSTTSTSSTTSTTSSGSTTPITSTTSTTPTTSTTSTTSTSTVVTSSPSILSSTTSSSLSSATISPTSSLTTTTVTTSVSSTTQAASTTQTSSTTLSQITSTSLQTSTTTAAFTTTSTTFSTSQSSSSTSTVAPVSTIASSITTSPRPSTTSTSLLTTTTSKSTTFLTPTTTTTSTLSGPTTVKNVPNFSYLNCYAEAVNIRALSSTSLVSSLMTVEKCATFCSGYTYMAVEYGQECYCGNTIHTAQGATPATDGRCRMPCAGNSNEICGGSYGLSMYQYQSSTPYFGCAVDQAVRTLDGISTSSSDMTVEKCLGFCAAYPLAGLEFGKECYCGGPGIAVGASGCSVPCGGNAGETCGGSWRLSVYNNTAYEPAADIGAYKYQGCYADAATRVLNGYHTASSSMTQESCVGTCKGKGFAVAGVEYGQECWCGSAMPTTKAADADCNMACSGDANEMCGGSLRFNVWST